MAHTHTTLLYHVVYSTKQRRPLLAATIMEPLVAFTGGLVREREGKLFAMSGTDNHVHLLVDLTAKLALCDQIRDIKANSSGWIRQTLPGMKDFAWQDGYGAFTVSKSLQPAVERYIARQVEHHRTCTFEEELIALLDRAGIEYDRRFVFD